MRTITVNGERAELFIPMMKFDERTGEFEGWSTVQEEDGHKETCDVAKSWPALTAWSDESKEISGGKSAGNLRVQHRRDSVGGKLTAMEMRDQDGKPAVFIKGLVTNEQAKKDAAEGALTGISIRGLLQRWEEGGKQMYAWKVVEEKSLVDRPAVKHALIEVMKSDGSVEQVKARGYDPTQGFQCRAGAFHILKDEARACDSDHEAAKSSKSDDEDLKALTAHERDNLSDDDFALPGRRYPIHDEAHARNALARVAQNGTPEEIAMVKKKVKARYPSIDVGSDDSGKKSLERDGKKSLYTVTQLLGVISALGSITSDAEYEAMIEAAGSDGDDDSAIVTQLKGLTQGAYDAAQAALQECRAELDADLAGDDDAMASDEAAYSAALRAIAKSDKAKEAIKSLRGRSSTGSSHSENSTEGEDMKTIEEATKALEDSQKQLADAQKELDAAKKELATTKSELDETSKSFDSLLAFSVEAVKSLGIKVPDNATPEQFVQAVKSAPAKPSANVRTFPVSKEQDTTDRAAAEGKKSYDEMSELEKFSPKNRKRIG